MICRRVRLMECDGLADCAVRRFYRYQAPLYDWTRWVFLYGRSEAVERLGLEGGSCVLDVGCGTGLNFGLMQRRLDPSRGGWIVGLDLSTDMLRRARRRTGSRGWANVSLVAGDAARFRLRRVFDAVLFAYSLTMISDWQGAIERAWEHLRPGGRLVVLDFGQFEGWGLAGRMLRSWLRLNRVESCRPYLRWLGGLFPDVHVDQRLGGYYFIAVAVKEQPRGGQLPVGKG